MNASSFPAAPPPVPESAEPGAPAPEILELRIHGIKNTTPAEMLGVEPDQVTRAVGDELGSFWIEKAPVERRARREAYSWGNMARSGGAAVAMIGTLFVHIGWLLILPFGLCNVAYWTRRIPNKQTSRNWNGGRGAPSLRLFALGLTLVYVTALASVSLDLIGVQCFPDVAKICSQLPSAFDAIAGLPRAQRLALLALIPLAIMMLLYAIAHRARVQYEPNISQLAKPLAGGEPVDGAPVAPVVPADVAAAVAPVARHAGPDEPARELTEPAAAPQTTTPTSSTPSTPAKAPTPLLATAEFWVQSRLAATTERLHFAAVLFFLAFLLSGDRLNVKPPTVPPGESNPLLVGSALVAPLSQSLSTSPIAAVCLGLTVAGLILVIILVFVASTTDPDRVTFRRGFAGWLLGAAALVFLVTGVSSLVNPDVQPRLPDGGGRILGVAGLEAAPTLLVAMLLGLSVAALGWRREVPPWVSLVVLIPALLCVLAGRALNDGSEIFTEAAGPYYVAAAALVVVELVLVMVFPLGSPWSTNHSRFAYEGWRGTGPGVVMLLALGVSMTLASLVVVGVAAYLATPFAPPPTGGIRTVEDFPLIVPPAYAEFGVVLLGILLVFLIFAAATLVPIMSRLYRLSTPALARDDPADKPGLEIVPLHGYGDRNKPEKAVSSDRVERRVLKARRFAALTQRGEPLLGFLAVTVGVGLAATVLLRIPEPVSAASPPRPDWVDWLIDAAPSIAIGILSAAALAAVGFITLNALTKAERPLGVLWDLICFLPRAGHPFGPPCYSDRVVPELNSRVRDWLDPREEILAERRVVLSAHSLGAVLAVSTLFAHIAGGAAGGPRRDGAAHAAADRAPRIALVTYGTQLRAYFGRFFPELLGPEVLGTRPCRAPRLFGGDPWLRQALDDERGLGRPAPAHASTLRAVLTPAPGADAVPRAPLWINLWRRTDFLGFPVDSYRPAPIRVAVSEHAAGIDRGASEIEPKTYLLAIATHGNYPDVAQYDGALDDLIERMLPGAGVPPLVGRPATAMEMTAVTITETITETVTVTQTVTRSVTQPSAPTAPNRDDD